MADSTELEVVVSPKARSVDRDGEPDGFVPGNFYRAEVLEGGFTRLVISVAPEKLEEVHRSIVSEMKPPFKVMYQQLTDRSSGQLPKPISRVGVEIGLDRLLATLEFYRTLVYRDGRHQLWIRGLDGSQLVLEEIGMLYLYPDDPIFRDVLEAKGVSEGEGETMATRDYVRVEFHSECDAEEKGLWQSLAMVVWAS